MIKNTNLITKFLHFLCARVDDYIIIFQGLVEYKNMTCSSIMKDICITRIYP